jgi:hypothetical protein
VLKNLRGTVSKNPLFASKWQAIERDATVDVRQ